MFPPLFSSFSFSWYHVFSSFVFDFTFLQRHCSCSLFSLPPSLSLSFSRFLVSIHLFFVSFAFFLDLHFLHLLRLIFFTSFFLMFWKSPSVSWFVISSEISPLVKIRFWNRNFSLGKSLLLPLYFSFFWKLFSVCTVFCLFFFSLFFLFFDKFFF